jgi:hypothetical protein
MNSRKLPEALPVLLASSITILCFFVYYIIQWALNRTSEVAIARVESLTLAIGGTSFHLWIGWIRAGKLLREMPHDSTFVKRWLYISAALGLLVVTAASQLIYMNDLSGEQLFSASLLSGTGTLLLLSAFITGVSSGLIDLTQAQEQKTKRLWLTYLSALFWFILGLGALLALFLL